MYGPTWAKRGEKSGDLNSRKLHKQFLELRSCDMHGGRLTLMTTSDSVDGGELDMGRIEGIGGYSNKDLLEISTH